MKIHLKEKLNPENFDNLTFPQLTEIAGYLMVYKISGLKSVSQFFPNLVTIRGGELFKTYALIINGNPDLEDIGLSHLKTITSGAVRIEKNSMLCYVNTVDWSTILNNETYGKSLFNVSFKV